jgi:hypothetical protein
MMSNGKCYQQDSLEHHTLEKECLSLPTPTASMVPCEKWKDDVIWWKQSRASRNLASIVKHPERLHFPTPTSRDYKDGTSCDNVPENGLLGRVVKPNKIEGALSADWVELLMGYPKGYTVVEWKKKRKISMK